MYVLNTAHIPVYNIILYFLWQNKYKLIIENTEGNKLTYHSQAI